MKTALRDSDTEFILVLIGTRYLKKKIQATSIHALV